MNYCFRYLPHSNYKDVGITEITIKGNYGNPDLINFLEEHKDYKINLLLKDFSFDMIKEYVEVYKETIEKIPELKLSFIIPVYDKKDMEELKEIDELLFSNGISYFFDTIITQWEHLDAIINTYHISEIYIGGHICFDIESVSKILKNKEIKIRVYPNRVLEHYPRKLRNFFIRPEDLGLYLDLIDTIEYFGPEDKQLIYHKVYTIHKKWLGNLNEIIYGVQENIDNSKIMPIFGARRLHCKQRCLFSGCRLCDALSDLSATINKKIEDFNKESLDL